MQNKKIWYSKLYIICLSLFIISIPLDFFIKDNILLLIINIFLKIISLIYIIYYSKIENFEKIEIKKLYKYHIIFLPFILITFSNFLVVLIDNIEINSSINYLYLSLSAISTFLTAVIEEVLFRHLLYKEFIKNKSQFKSILYTSLIFGGLHLLNITTLSSIPYCIIQSLYTFGIGIILSIIYVYSKNITLPISLHFLFNFINDFLVTYLFNITWNSSFFIVNILISIIIGIYTLLIFIKLNTSNISFQ